MAKKIIAIQAGHAPPLQPGHETETGAAGERELNIIVRDQMCRLLASDGRFKALALPGKIPNGIKCDAFIALHADGARNPGATGFSFGYPDPTINKRLADCIRSEYRSVIGHPPQHATDNYTPDEHFYYGFNHINTPGPEVLWEVGFVSNPAERKWLYNNTHDLALVGYKGILRFYGLKQPHESKTVKYPFVVRIQDKDNTWSVYPSFGGTLPARFAQFWPGGKYKSLSFERKVTVVSK